MPKPQPPKLTPQQVLSRVREIIAADRFPYLATIDGEQPRLRPVSPVRSDLDHFVIHVANLKAYHKTIELAANPRCELCYLDERHDQVRLTGVAEVETDAAVIDAIWADNPLLRQYLGSPDNPQLIIYRIRPTQVRFMQEWSLEYYDIPLP